MPSALPELETKSSTEHATPWNVIVWNDPINLMSYVVYVFQKVLGFDHQKATKHMLEVHEQGKSCVATEVREKAELYVQQFHHFGLKSSLEKAA